MFSSNKKIKKYFILGNVNEHDVILALVDKNSKNIIAKSKVSTTINNDHDDARKFAEIGRIFELSLNQLVKKINHKTILNKNIAISNAIIFYGLPWFHAHIKNITLKKSSPFKLTEESLNKIIANERSNICDINQSTNGNIGIDVVDCHIAEIFINGSATESPFNKEADEVLINAIIITAYADITKKIKSLLDAHFNDLIINFKSALTSDIDYITNIIYSDTYPYTISLKIRDNITEIIVFKGSKVTVVNSLPYGRRDIVVDISKGIGTSLESAETLLNLYIDGAIDEKNHAILQRITNNFANLLIEDIVLFAEKSGLSRKELEHTQLVLIGQSSYINLLFILLKPSSLFKKIKKDENNFFHPVDEDIHRDVELTLKVLHR